MSETPKGTDLPNPTIEVAGMRFSTRLGVASAIWLESEFGCGFSKIGEKLKDATAGDNVSIGTLVSFAIAFYIQANLTEDPELARQKIRGLDLEDLMQVVSKSLANDFEPKDETDDIVPLVEAPQEST